MNTLDNLIPNKAALARHLGLAPHTVYRWVTKNAVPPSRAHDVGDALHLDLKDLLQYVAQTESKTRIRPKHFKDLDVLEAAYLGKPYTLPPSLTEHAIRITLGHWKDRLPQMVATLKAVKAGQLTREQAAEHLGITYSTVKKLIKRYDAAPAKVAKATTRNQRNKDVAPDAILDVISGRKTAVQAAIDHNLNLRTLHRHLAQAMAPHSLNEITHWSPIFRQALAWEVKHRAPRVVAGWRTPTLPKQVHLPPVPADLKSAPTRILLLHVLTGELEIGDLTAERGGNEQIWSDLLRSELAQLGIHSTPSVYHKAAAAEVLWAKFGENRLKTSKKRHD